MVYLDNNATTPVDPRVCSAIQVWNEEKYGNASIREYALGWDSSRAVEDSRQSVGDILSAESSEIIFTSGATEGLNAAIMGFVTFKDWERKKIITCRTEHDAVLAPCLRLKNSIGIDLQLLPVDSLGNLDLDALRYAVSCDKETLVVLMASNNEIGTYHPIREIGGIAHDAGALFLVDCTQALGKIPIDVHADGIDMAAFSAHKMYGPKGVGALFVRGGRPEIKLEPLIVGGGQERGLRGGTLNVPGIVGFGEACKISQEECADEAVRVGRLRDRLEEALLDALPDIWINGNRKTRVTNTSNIGFAGVDARTLIRDMHDIAVSTQAACATGNSGPSHVLKAIGLTDEQTYSCVRFSLGRFTTAEEVDYAIHKVVHSARKLRRQRVSS